MIKFGWVETFYVLMIGLTFFYGPARVRLGAYTKSSLVLDLVALFMHFVGRPLMVGYFIFAFYGYVLLPYKNSFKLGWSEAVILVVLLSYVDYWGHRLLHSVNFFWRTHIVHHSIGSEINPMSATRNSIWSSFFIIYFWSIPLTIFLVKDPSRYLTLEGVALIITFWLHSSFHLPRNSIVTKFFQLFLVLPEDHHWHHSRRNEKCNYGALFNFWDKMHGTWYQPQKSPQELGSPHNLSILKQIFYPFEKTL